MVVLATPNESSVIRGCDIVLVETSVVIEIPRIAASSRYSDKKVFLLREGDPY